MQKTSTNGVWAGGGGQPRRVELASSNEELTMYDGPEVPEVDDETVREAVHDPEEITREKHHARHQRSVEL